MRRDAMWRGVVFLCCRLSSGTCLVFSFARTTSTAWVPPPSVLPPTLNTSLAATRSPVFRCVRLPPFLLFLSVALAHDFVRELDGMCGIGQRHGHHRCRAGREIRT